MLRGNWPRCGKKTVLRLQLKLNSTKIPFPTQQLVAPDTAPDSCLEVFEEPMVTTPLPLAPKNA